MARAIAKKNAKFIVLDEPTSALDASLQAQVLNLLIDIKRKLGLTYLFITHNIAVAYYISDRVAIMYAGKVVEYGGDKEEIFRNPAHPYTQSLMASIPTMNKKELQPPTGGEVPSLINPPSGCRFHPRCPFAMDICKQKEPPPLVQYGKRKVACWLHNQ